MRLAEPQPTAKQCAWDGCGKLIYRPPGISNHAWSIRKYHQGCSPSRRGVISMVTKPKPVVEPPKIPDVRQSQGWRLRAACRDDDPELFFPVSEAMTEQIEEAKFVCSICPVRRECLTWAVESGCNEGIFGGLTEWERDRFARELPGWRRSA